uniref:Ribosomal protein L7Ae/L30e/S12e/Gadd45 domain-containing protein n=1 Tax=Aquila chrysaetos chrysaetos TaxID=223781 RepID=A0A663FCH4_AQUCH
KEMAHQTKQATLEFIKSKLQLVIKSAEYMLLYKQALKAMQQGKVKLAILVNSTPALKKIRYRIHMWKIHILLSVIQVTDIIRSTLEQKSEK